ncbi:MAG: MBL fold metallo-hydrolase, partial [Nitrososphaerales archaeon]
GTVLHWPQGANSRGVVLSGDIIKSAEDRRWAAFMYSYPNMIPLSGKIVRRMADTICTYKFERMYSSFEDLEIISKARAAVRRSADRYIRFLRVS